jgi:hypothetical protein
MSRERELFERASRDARQRWIASGRSLVAGVNEAVRRHPAAAIAAAAGTALVVGASRSARAPRPRRGTVISSLNFLVRMVALQAVAALAPQPAEVRNGGVPIERPTPVPPTTPRPVP